MHRTTRGQQTSWRVRRSRGLGWTVAVTLAILAGPVGPTEFPGLDELTGHHLG